jgi:hypothetical protein
MVRDVAEHLEGTSKNKLRKLRANLLLSLRQCTKTDSRVAGVERDGMSSADPIEAAPPARRLGREVSHERGSAVCLELGTDFDFAGEAIVAIDARAEEKAGAFEAIADEQIR